MVHPFEVGKTYRNRAGEYVVVSIDDNQMKIRYTDGKTLLTSVAIQARIWENIQLEERLSRAEERKRQAQEARLAAKKQTREARVKVEFGGFQESDFQPKGRGIAWSSRQQLGRALAYELRRRTKSGFAFWAVPRQPLIYLARKDRYTAEAHERNAVLFVEAGERGLSFGFRVGKAEGDAPPESHWSILLAALTDDAQVRESLRSAMAAHALSLELYAMQLEYRLVGRIVAQEGQADSAPVFQWHEETADEQITRPMAWEELVEQLRSLSAASRCGLYVQTQLAPEPSVQAGPAVVSQVFAVLEALVPMYEASTRV